MEIASEKRMIAATNLKLKVEYDYSVSRSSYHGSVPGASQRIPICTLPYQNRRTTQGLQVNILVKMGFGIKFLLLFWLGILFSHFCSRSYCLPPTRKWKIICANIFNLNKLSIQNLKINTCPSIHLSIYPSTYLLSRSQVFVIKLVYW